MLDLVRLKVFIHAAEQMSFSQAAREMQISQPTVSHHIKSLEREIGRPLFHRGGGKLELTEVGRLLLPYARKLIREAQELQARLASINEGISGIIRIAACTTAAKVLLPPLAARFHSRHANVQVSVVPCTDDGLFARILEGDIQFAVLNEAACSEEYEIQEFAQDELCLIAPVGHPWSERGSIDPWELMEPPFLLNLNSACVSGVLKKELAKHDLSFNDLNIIQDSGCNEGALASVEAGFGVSILSRLSASCALEVGRVVNVEISQMNLGCTSYMARVPGKRQNRLAEAFWNFMRDPAAEDFL